MLENTYRNTIKGFVIGAFMLIPGASGGTLAIILGIYDDLIHAVSGFRDQWKQNALLLAAVGLGAVLGLILLSGPMLTAVTRYQKPMLYLFLGAIAGSIPTLYRKASVSRIKTVNLLAAVAGSVIGILTIYLPADLVRFESLGGASGLLVLFLAGMFIAVALILPGISASYFLLMLGMYQLTLDAIKRVDLVYLAPLLLGILLGTLLTAEILEREMKKHPQFTYMIIIGFMAGSLIQVYPGLPLPGIELAASLTTLATGFLLTHWLGLHHKS